MGVLAPLHFSGTYSYIRLRYQLAAIQAAEDGLKGFDELEVENATKQSAVEVVAGFLEEADFLIDHFRCAAYIMQQWKPVDPHEREIAVASANDYNDIASGGEERGKLSKAQFERGSANTSKAALIRDAERTAAIDKRTQAAQANLMDLMGYSLLLAVDLTDTKATATPYLNLTCGERDTILSISKEESEVKASDYQKAAGLIYRVLTERTCHQQS